MAFFVKFSFLVTKFNDIARNLYSQSLHPSYGYHFAIVSINITSWTYKMLTEGDLKNHFYNTSHFIDTDRIKLEHFFRIYSKRNFFYCKFKAFLIS